MTQAMLEQRLSLYSVSLTPRTSKKIDSFFQSAGWLLGKIHTLAKD